MTDIAIRVENLSKQYRIGGPQARYKTIRALWNRPLLQSLSWNMTCSTGLAFAVAAHRSTCGSAGSPCSSRRRLEPEILLVDEVMVCPESGWRCKEVEPGVLRCRDWPEDEPLPMTNDE